MAAYENVRVLSMVATVNGATDTPSRFRFVKNVDGGAEREVELCEAGDVPVGICAQNPALKLDPNNAEYVAPAFQVAVPDGGINLIELGEAVTDLTVPLSVGADGKAVLADAAGQVQVGMPTETGAVGEVIAFQFLVTSPVTA